MAIIASDRGIVIVEITDNLTLVETNEKYLDGVYVTSIIQLDQGRFLVCDRYDSNLHIINTNTHKLETTFQNPSKEENQCQLQSIDGMPYIVLRDKNNVSIIDP